MVGGRQLAPLPARRVAGDEREDDGRDGEGEDADRQLHHPRGEVEHGGRAVVEGEADEPGDRDVDEVDGGADHGRSHQAQDLAHALVRPQVELRPPALAPEHRGGHGHLEEAADQDGAAEQAHPRRLVPRPPGAEAERGEDDEVEPDGRQGRFREAPEHLAGAAERRREADEHHVGEEHDREVGAEQEAAAGRGREPGALGEGDERVGLGQRDDRDADDDRGRDEEPARDLAHEAERALAPALLQFMSQRRHERARQGALAQQAPEEVRQREGGDEGRVERAGAEDGGGRDLAHQAEHAGDDGEARDEADVLEALRHGGAESGPRAAPGSDAGPHGCVVTLSRLPSTPISEIFDHAARKSSGTFCLATRARASAPAAPGMAWSGQEPR